MGWKDAFDYMRSGAAKRGFGADTERQDGGLPLGARIGSLVTLQQSPLIRANAGGSLIAMPGAADTRIVAVSQIRLNMAGGLFRFYMATGDTDAKEKFLQVFRNAQGEIAEIMYCTQIARIVPETAEDQEAYTGEAGYGLGDRSFTLWREQLADLLDAGDLAAAFGDAGQIVYRRDAGENHAEFSPPFSGSEIRIDDAAGAHGLQQDMYFMPYVRELRDGGHEYLLITTEIVNSVDGDTSKRGIHVDFVVGIPLEAGRVTVQ